MMKRIVGSTLSAAALVALIACQRETVEFGPSPSTEPSSFASTQDSGASDASEAGLTSYCPSNECPAGRTTCPSSRFLCDVNLLADRENCGECGNRCSDLSSGPSNYECIEGRCALTCDPVMFGRLDCDGIPDNGCEARIDSNENCGGCGIECAPDKPCIKLGATYKCGCSGEKIACDDGFGNQKCVDPKTDDNHCGGCGVACDPASGEGSLPLNARFGCVGGQCGRVKCEADFLDCDSDLSEEGSNGCESSAWSRDSCGMCNNACDAGQECHGNQLMQPICACPAGQTYCPVFCMDLGDVRRCMIGICADLAADANNCGACFHNCRDTNTSSEVCSYGVCESHCIKGRADCNGNLSDGCEVDVDHDPNNCGACGTRCDAVSGQACVGGRCVVEPCGPTEGDGGLAR